MTIKERSLLISNVDTAISFGLILSSWDIQYPKAKEIYVDIPMGDGDIDLTNHGGIKYDMRKATFNFILVTPYSDREVALEKFSRSVHGLFHTVTIPDDLGYEYWGRLSIDSVKRGAMVTEIKMSALFRPYKLKKGITKSVYTVLAGQTNSATIVNNGREVIPTIRVTAELDLTVGSTTVTLSPNVDHRNTVATLYKKSNILVFKNKGTANPTATITYQEEVL